MVMTNVCEIGKGERKGTDKLLVLESPKLNVFYYCRKILYLQILSSFMFSFIKREYKGR